MGGKNLNSADSDLQAGGEWGMDQKRQSERHKKACMESRRLPSLVSL